MNVGDKVWVKSHSMVSEEWLKAVVVPLPEGAAPRRGAVCVCFENRPDEVYRVPKYEVKERND